MQILLADYILSKEMLKQHEGNFVTCKDFGEKLQILHADKWIVGRVKMIPLGSGTAKSS